MITLSFAVDRRTELQGTPKKIKSKKKYARKEIFLQGNRERSLQPKNTLDRVSVERNPQR
jgi:hypothetical protein